VKAPLTRPTPTATSLPDSRPERAISSIAAFRGEQRVALPLHPLEKTLVVAAALHTCGLAWALGGMHVGAQIFGAVMGVLAFALALWPRNYRGDYAPEKDFRLIMWPKLMRFPIFWLGLALLIYVLIQGFNPAWMYVQVNNKWWLQSIPHVEWLPSSVYAPFQGMNLWRMVLIYTPIWLLACALWVGLTRRSAVQALLTTIAINGTVLALWTLIMKGMGLNAPLGFLTLLNDNMLVVGPFLYKNHGGAYFCLMAATSASLAVWAQLRMFRRQQRSSPAPIWALSALLAGIVVILSNSRAATALFTIFLAASLLAFTIWYLKNGRQTTGAIPVFLLIITLIGLGGFSVTYFKLDQKIAQINSAMQTEDWSRHSRSLLRDATFKAIQKQTAYGWGAGAFRHVFPNFQQQYPDIFRPGWNKKLALGWEYAHCDPLQAVAEVGLFGTGLIAALLVSGIILAVRFGLIHFAPALTIIAGLILTCLHSWVDFIFSNPGIVVAWTCLAVLALKWTQMEAQAN
jgi:hypothetical protein